MLFIDQVRPRTLDELGDLHPQVTQMLRRLVETGDMPHLLFAGPAGSGRRTRINALLRALYGPGVDVRCLLGVLGGYLRVRGLPWAARRAELCCSGWDYACFYG